MAIALGPRRLGAALVLAATTWSAPAATQGADESAPSRARLVAEIVDTARRAADITGRPTLDARVLEAIGAVPRHRFVPPALERFAYLDQPLPVGHGQTVSQPFIVALMTDLARIAPADRVLEVGVGGGYHAAILAELAAEVFSVELIEPVAEAARARLAGQGYANVEIRVGDGYFGWHDEAPFDVIIIRLAVNHVPGVLLNQLKPGGRLVAPIGPPERGQDLTLIEKDAGGRLSATPILPVIFTYLPGGDRI